MRSAVAVDDGGLGGCGDPGAYPGVEDEGVLVDDAA